MRARRDLLLAAALAVVCCLSAARADDTTPAPSPKPANPSVQSNPLFQSLQLGSGKGPIRIDSDSLELDYKGSIVTYKGHVHAEQGDITMTSDRLTIAYDPSAVRAPDKPTPTPAPGAASKAAAPQVNQIKEIVAEGDVRITQGTRLATGRRAVFDQAKQTVVLSDGAVLHDGPNQVAGERVIVYLQEERSVVESGSNSRVKAVLYPNKDEAEAKATPTPVQAAAGAPSSRP